MLPELVRWSATLLIPAIAALGGIALGAWMNDRRDRRLRRHQFAKEQLQHFYSPFLGLRSEIRAKGELRVHISSAADSAWREMCARFEKDPESLRAVMEEKGDEFTAIIEYDNRRLQEEVIPAYQQMVVLFRQNMWLVDPATRQEFPKLLEFLDIWERWLAGALPAEVVQKLGHDEKALHQLYSSVERRHDELQAKLATGEL